MEFKRYGLTLVSLFFGYHAVYAQGVERKVDCRWNTEAIVSALRIDDIENKTIGIEIEYWSDYFQIEGFTFNGISAAKAKVYFPKSRCLIQEKSTDHPYLIACGLGIGTGSMRPIQAQLTTLDGSQHQVTLDTNVIFEVEHNVRTSVFESRSSDTVSATFGLINAGDRAIVGFDLNRYCK